MNFIKKNSEEELKITPISVLRYISELEKKVKHLEESLEIEDNYIKTTDDYDSNTFSEYEKERYNTNMWFGIILIALGVLGFIFLILNNL